MALFAWTMYSLIGCGFFIHQLDNKTEGLFWAVITGILWPIELGGLINQVLDKAAR